MNEDRCRVSAGERPLSTLRNAAIDVIRRLGLARPAGRENVREYRAEATMTTTGQIH